MRILMSIHHPMDPKLSPAGVTSHLANAMHARGHSVDILSYDSMRLRGKSQFIAFPFFVASFILKHGPYDVLDLSAKDGSVLSLLPRACLGEPAPVIVARSHGLDHMAHEVYLELERLGLKKLSWKYKMYHGGLRLWECQRCFTRADLALFLNGFERQYAVQRLGVRPSRAAIVKNGISRHFVERARSLLACSHATDRPQKIAFIGRYSQTKGSDDLRIAMGSILADYPQSALGIFGAMESPDVVVADYPVEYRHRITVVPTYDNEELVNLLRGYDILAFPSIIEGFGIAPLEAMACGVVPVVAAAPGPMSYIEDGRNGIVVPVRNAAALQTAIAELLNDPQQWHVLRYHALTTALNYSWDAVASETEELYEMAIRNLRAVPSEGCLLTPHNPGKTLP